MNTEEKLMEAAKLRLRLQMNNRLRLEFLAAVSRLFREHEEPMPDDLLASLVLAVPEELRLEMEAESEELQRDSRVPVESVLPGAHQVARPPFGRIPEEEEPPTGKPPLGKAPLGKPPLGKPPLGKPPLGKPPLGTPPMGKPPLGEPPQARPPLGKAPLGKPPMGTPPEETLLEDEEGPPKSSGEKS